MMHTPLIARFLPVLGASLLALALPIGAQAQQWPDKPIRMVVPLPPGGPSDIVLRTIAPVMQQVLKQPLVIDNKPGANGNIGATEVARAPADGYTWLWTTDTTLTVNPHVYDKMPFKVADFQSVMRATAFSQTLVCHPQVGVKTVAEFVRKAKAKPNGMTYASGGAGSPGHLVTELFSAAAGIDLTHVPYKGPAPAVQDMLGGQVDCGFLAGPTVLPHVRAGKLVALAVSGGKRSPVLPEVPTVAESGYPRFDAAFSLVLLAPKDTPAAIVQKMQAELATALKLPGTLEKLAQSDQFLVAESPVETAARLAQDSAKWGEVARRINLKME
jgi:tripartite-type tricarboxylate transporter receptor subunit TctC